MSFGTPPTASVVTTGDQPSDKGVVGHADLGEALVGHQGAVVVEDEEALAAALVEGLEVRQIQPLQLSRTWHRGW
jgi:hypothetical protein